MTDGCMLLRGAGRGSEEQGTGENGSYSHVKTGDSDSLSV